jgi:hypothetical protein
MLPSTAQPLNSPPGTTDLERLPKDLTRPAAEVEAAAGTLGLTVVTVEIRRMEDIAPGFRGG